MATLPPLWLASFLAQIPYVTLAIALVAGAVPRAGLLFGVKVHV